MGWTQHFQDRAALQRGQEEKSVLPFPQKGRQPRGEPGKCKKAYFVIFLPQMGKYCKVSLSITQC